VVIVYAVEASTMAEQAEVIIKSNAMHDRITVVRGRMEVSSKYSTSSCNVPELF